MRITFVLSSLWLAGGVHAVIDIANRLAQRGHTLALVVPGGSVGPEMRARLMPAVRLIESGVARATDAGNRRRNLRLLWSLARAIPPSDCIVSTHTPTTLATLLARLWPAHWATIPLWLYMDYAEMFAGRPLELWLLRHALAWHRAALSISGPGVAEARRNVAGDSYYIGLGLSEAARFYPQLARPSRRDGRPRILYVGDERPRKGLADCLAAVELARRDWPNVELWLVTKGPLVQTPVLPHRHFLRPDDAELARLYRECDIFLSTTWREGVGLPPLEAMASGAAVVMTDSVGARDYARHGENCLLVPPRQPRLLAGALGALLAAPALAQRLADAGRATAAAFDYERVTDRFELIIHALATRQPVPEAALTRP